MNLNAVNISGADNATSDIQYKEKINDFRNRLAEEGYSEAGEEVWSGQPIRRGFESAVSLVAKSEEATATKGAVLSMDCKF